MPGPHRILSHTKPTQSLAGQPSGPGATPMAATAEAAAAPQAQSQPPPPSQAAPDNTLRDVPELLEFTLRGLGLCHAEEIERPASIQEDMFSDDQGSVVAGPPARARSWTLEKLGDAVALLDASSSRSISEPAAQESTPLPVEMLGLTPSGFHVTTDGMTTVLSEPGSSVHLENPKK